MQTTSSHNKSNSEYWVAKFGGTSVATHSAISQCIKTLKKHPNVRLVIVSAQAGVTNLLVKLSKGNLSFNEIKSVTEEIIKIINNVLDNIQESVLPHLQNEIKEFLQNIIQLANLLRDKQDLSFIDELLSYGERISARLFTLILTSQGYNATYLDARKLIKTNDSYGKAEVLIAETKQQVQEYLKCLNTIVITEGFIGSTLQDKTTTLGRGGSDYSAALLAEAIEAKVLQIWTDVTGVYTADPRLIAHAKPIENMCFTAAAELATFGAKVLHPATLWPAIRKNIPVYVGSSMFPNDKGTWIRSQDTKSSDSQLHAITLRRKQSLLTIHSLEMLNAHGFLAKIFTILANNKLSVDLVTTSEVSVALTFNHTNNGVEHTKLLTEDILNELQTIGNISLKIDNDLCLIALVGNNLHLSPGISGRIFNLIRAFNVRLICHGASSHNVCFLVNESDAEPIIKILHAEFFEK